MSDRVRFRCKRCGECCRNLDGILVVESLDAYCIAKHLGISVESFYLDYAEMRFFEDTDFPLFTIKAVGKRKECIFLKGNRCSVQEVKPRVCKMYPFWVGPSEGEERFTYYFCTERQHHPRGALVKVNQWMRDNFSEDAKRFLEGEDAFMMKFAPLYQEAQKRNPEETGILQKILLLRYFMFETNEPFLDQYERNNQILLEEMEQMCK